MSVHSLKKNRSMLSGNQILQTAPQPLSMEKMEPVDPNPSVHNETVRHQLPSGHQVVIDLDGNEIEVEDPGGAVAVRILMNAEGPVVELEGAKLQLKSTKAVNVDCEEFNVNADKNVYMNAGGHLTLESSEELHINCEVDIRLRAKVIWLN